MIDKNLSGNFIGGAEDTTLSSSVLTMGTRKYAVPSRPADKDKAGFYFPDSVVDLFFKSRTCPRSSR